MDREDKIKLDERNRVDNEVRRVERQSIVQSWIQEGCSPSEIQILAKAMFG